MQIVGSKAFYLKNYTIKSRTRTEPHQRSKSPSEAARLTDIMRIRNLSSNRCDENINEPYWQPPRYHAKHSTKLQTIQEKEHQLLQRVCKSKLPEQRSNRARCVSVTVQRHPIAEVNSLEFQSMKPTNRYFQQVENVRLAQRLLLARPSRDITRITQQKFYEQQEAYRNNISKLSSSRRHPPRQHSLHRKKWLD